MQEIINIYGLVLLVIFNINLGLGLFVFFKGRHIEPNRIFSLLIVSISLWVLSCFMLLINHLPEWALLLRRMTPAAAALIAAFFLYFSLVFRPGPRPISAWVKALIMLPALIFAALSIFTPLLIKDFIVQPGGSVIGGQLILGPVYYLFGLFFIIYFLAGLTHLVMKYRRALGRDRLQIFYVLFGVGAAGAGGIMMSLLLPIAGYYDLFIFGPPFTLLMTGSIAYAMIRYRLMDIEDFLSRGLAFVSFILFLIGTFYFIFRGDFKYLLAFYVVLANIFAALFVLSNNPKSRLNQVFFLLTLTVAAWSFSLSIYQMSGKMIWAVLAYAFSSFIPAVFLSFARVFPKYDEKEGIIDLLSYLFAFILSGLSFTGLIISDTVTTSWGYTLVLGPLYPLFAFNFIGIVFYGFSRLFDKYRRTSGISRVQIMYVTLGIMIAVIVGVTTAILLPLLGFPNLYFLAAPSTLIMIGFIAYTIVKHRLMSIEIVIQRSTAYGVATILILALYALAIAVSENLLRNILGYTSLLVTSAAALMIAIAYQPLVGFFQNVADRIFFRDRYDYQKTLRKISQEIASVIKLEELTRLIVSSFVDTMKVSEISFLLSEREGEHFSSVPISIPRYKKIEIDVSNPIVSWLSKTKDILVDDELDDEIARRIAQGEEGEESFSTLSEVKEGMERLGISVWVPIISKEGLVGIIALGKKLSGDLFTSEDIGLLSTLANQTSVALDNARLYEEMVNLKDYNEEVLQSMVSGVLTVDIKGRIITFNSMAEGITGRKAAEILGKTVREVWGERGSITGAVEETLKKEKRYINYESGITSPEKGLIPVSFSSTILYDHKKKKNGALLTISDLTGVKELEEKVRRADKLSALATMAAGMAHEIKNPLSSMKVLSQLLPIKYQDEEFRGKFIEIMPKEINRIDRIVESLLGFARATSPKYEKLKIEDVIEDNVKYYRDQARAGGIEIAASYALLPEIMGDHDQLVQVFSNLILNAIQAMPDGGQLKIISCEGKKIENLLQNIIIEISDTGHGISPQNMKKLFDPFFTTKYSGTGLGLTIVHNIVDGHRGTIDVKSEPGKGTTFIITLPVGQELI